MERLKTLIKGTDLIVVPVALNAIMARLAEEAGFKAVYLSGGSLGWLKCVTEANLTLPEMAQVAVEMRSVCKLPIILDAGGGWGDPAHIYRTIALSEGSILRVRLRSDVQGRAPVLRIARARNDRSASRPGRSRQRNEGGSKDRATGAASGGREENGGINGTTCECSSGSKASILGNRPFNRQCRQPRNEL